MQIHELTVTLPIALHVVFIHVVEQGRSVENSYLPLTFYGKQRNQELFQPGVSQIYRWK